MGIRVVVAEMAETHRKTHWVRLINETGQSFNVYHDEHRERTLFTAAEYAKFLGDTEAYDTFVAELRRIDPVMAQLLEEMVELDGE